jgi:hypothetical protein
VAENDPQQAKSYVELRKRTDEELIGEHDLIRGTKSIGVEYYLNELARRTAQRQTRTMVDLTRVIVRLTWVIAGLALISLGFVIYAATN